MWITDEEVWDLMPDHCWLRRFVRYGTRAGTEPAGHWLLAGLSCLSQLTGTAIVYRDLRIAPNLQAVMVRRGRSANLGARALDTAALMVGATWPRRVIADPSDISLLKRQLARHRNTLATFDTERACELLIRPMEHVLRRTINASLQELPAKPGTVEVPGIGYGSLADRRLSSLYRVRARDLVPQAWSLRATLLQKSTTTARTSDNRGGSGNLLAHCISIASQDERTVPQGEAEHELTDLLLSYLDLASHYSIPRGLSTTLAEHLLLQQDAEARMAANFKGLDPMARNLFGAFVVQAKELLTQARHPVAISRLPELCLRVAYLLTLDAQGVWISNDGAFDRPWSIGERTLDVAIRIVGFSSRTALAAIELQRDDATDETVLQVRQVVGRSPMAESAICGATGIRIRLIRRAVERLLEEGTIQQTPPGDPTLGDRDEPWFVLASGQPSQQMGGPDL